MYARKKLCVNNQYDSKQQHVVLSSRFLKCCQHLTNVYGQTMMNVEHDKNFSEDSRLIPCGVEIIYIWHAVAVFPN